LLVEDEEPLQVDLGRLTGPGAGEDTIAGFNGIDQKPLVCKAVAEIALRGGIGDLVVHLTAGVSVFYGPFGHEFTCCRIRKRKKPTTN
jgi:hypothetical protein